jgi:cysteine-rich repeat protein
MAQYFGNLCGDGTLEAGEACDDGNTVAGDCCSPTCTFEAAGAGCADDGDACTVDACDGAGACTHGPVSCALCESCDSALGCVERPRAGCLGIAPAGRSSLQLRDRVPDSSDVARWKWQSGVVAIGDFGDPLTTDDYGLCVYQGAGQALWLRSVAPRGGACSFKPCWKKLQPNGAKYVDRELTPDGVSSLVLRSNVPGRIQLKLKAKGTSLALPSLASLTLPIRVQLQRSGGACWDVTYATASTATPSTFAASAR